MIHETTHQLEAGRADDVRALTGTLANRIEADGMPASIRRQILFRMIVVFDNFMEQICPQEGDRIRLEQVLEDGAPEELEHRMMQKMENSLLLLAQDPHSPPSLSIDKITAFVRSRYTNPDFSLQEIANYFSVSVPYVSQFFKDNCGSNLLAYYTHLRMEEAKRLMTQTDLSFKVIAAEVGYLNTSSFIRRFKQLYGITPGEYKKDLGNSVI